MPAATTRKPAAAVPPADAVALDAHWAAKMERLRNRTLAEAPLRVCDDITVRDAHRAAQARAARMRALADSQPGDADLQSHAAQAQVDAEQAERAYEEASEVLMMRALPRPVYEALVEAHPPTPDQAEKGNDWNADTFCAALIAASYVGPMTDQDAQELLDTWGIADANELFLSAFNVQSISRTDLGKG